MRNGKQAMSDGKIYADFLQPATLRYGAKADGCFTLQEAVLEWMRLSEQDRAQATIRVKSGTVYKANEINRLHVGCEACTNSLMAFANPPRS